jgi:LPS-assembly lipoprotein
MRAGWSRASIVLLACLLAGCGGWYLRGKGPVKARFDTVYIKAPAAFDIAQAVRRELYNRGLRVVNQRKDADIVVEIEGESYDRRVLSVDPDTGKVREIELALEAYFSVRTGDGRLLVPREPLNWQLDYVFDEASVLGTVEQDVTVQRDLAEIAATTLVLRLQTLEVPPRVASAGAPAE